MTRWIYPPPVEIPASFADLHLHPLVAQTLVRRGIAAPEAVSAFLHPESHTSVPFPNIEPALERILQAVRRNEPVCVWGDFDVDGQTSTSLLVQTLQMLGANVLHYIPIRGKESHGVHIESLKPILDHGAGLILTCDTGITAHEAIEYANSRGVDVVITDHHDLGETLPDAKAIVNPKMLPEGHILGNLAGVGVAFKVAEALLSQRSNIEGRGSPEELLDLVALGLIADVVDGYYVGIVDEFDGNFQKLRLDEGPHRLEGRKEGFETLAFDVRVTFDHTIKLRGELKPASP